MKKLLFTLFNILICASIFQANSQTISLTTQPPNEQKTIAVVKAFEGRYLNSKVYLHLTINGNTETKLIAVERSLDNSNYEVIGYIKIYGTNVLCDLAYYFKDELPVSANLFYRLSDYSPNNEPVYSETISVIPIDKTKVSTDMVIIAPIVGEEILVGASN